MHNPTTTIDTGSTTVIGTYCNAPLLRWTEENSSRTFEEQVFSGVGASGTTYGATFVVGVAA